MAHRFAFGSNWQNFLETVTGDEIREAVDNLARLVPGATLEGKHFLDIGCGSGLHALAAVRLGAKSVAAFDIDENSVQATQKILAEHAPGYPAEVTEKSILRAEANTPAAYDVVYSWGVLHHTGAMWQAIRNAAGYVAPGGAFVIAIYKRTPLCGFWRIEKAVYSRLPGFLHIPVTALFSGLYLAGVLACGRNPVRYVREYKGYRGMSFWHDMIDWLGGYPYESATPEEIKNFCASLGFRFVVAYNAEPVKAAGMFGSGCAEYVFAR